MRSILITSLLCITGCAVSSAPTPFDTSSTIDAGNSFDEKNGYATDYIILIDPTFATDDLNNITSAIQDWSMAVPVKFTIWLATCNAAQPGQICIHNYQNIPIDQRPCDDAVDAGGTMYLGCTAFYKTYADTYLYLSTAQTQNTNPNSFWFTALHELGHAQGLLHHNGPYLMNPCGVCGGATNITADDANQWLTLRGYNSIPEDAGLIQ